MAAPRLTSELAHAALSLDGEHLVTSTFEGAIACHHVRSGRVLHRFGAPVRSHLVWSPDGRRVAFRSLRGGAYGDYSVTVVDPFVGVSRVVAELHPDNGGALGFDFTPDGGTFVFADEVERDGRLVAHLVYVDLTASAEEVVLPRGAPRRSHALPRGAVPEKLVATAEGVFSWYEYEGWFTRDDGSLAWRIEDPHGGHSVAGARNAMVSGTVEGFVHRAFPDTVARVQGGLSLGNVLAWSADGARFVASAALPAGEGFVAGHAVFKGPSLVGTVRDAQPQVVRDVLALGGYLLDGWCNVALDARGEALVLADNEAGELRAWALGPAPRILWRCELDDLSYVMWNGSTVVAASASQVMFVDGERGRVIARTPVSG